MEIKTEIECPDRDAAIKLGEVLSSAGADSYIARQRGRWTVFANYEPSDAAHFGRALLDHGKFSD